jgi:hypothetical protein
MLKIFVYLNLFCSVLFGNYQTIILVPEYQLINMDNASETFVLKIDTKKELKIYDIWQFKNMHKYTINYWQIYQDKKGGYFNRQYLSPIERNFFTGEVMYYLYKD